MNPSRFSPTRRLVAGFLLGAALLLGGCLEKNIVWSPDGTRAAVLADDGLRLCSADGTLSPAVTPEVYHAVWLADSRRLLVARERPATGWPEVAAALGAERSRQISDDAEATWSRFKAGAPWGLATTGLDKQLKFRLRDLHGPELRDRLPAKEWEELAGVAAPLHEIGFARAGTAGFEFLATVFCGIDRIVDLRLSRCERAVAITTTFEPRSSERFRLAVLPLDPAGAPEFVETETAAYPDWTADGRSLLYLHAAARPAGDLPQFAVLQQREVFGADGKFALAEKATELGGGIFQPFGRIRCLADGRIVFNATELALPLSARDFQAEREQLFALDPARQSTLSRLIPRANAPDLPKMLSFFEPSPDGKTLLFGGDDGEVCVLTLATGEVEVVQKNGHPGQPCLPAWRGPGEFTYLKRTEAKDGKKPARPFELVLRHGGEETVLSRTWPDAVLEGVTK